MFFAATAVAARMASIGVKPPSIRNSMALPIVP
jgi:hypothetical protein